MSENLESRSPVNKPAFIVTPEGETTGEIEHLKQVQLEFIKLSPAQTFTEIDVRKVTGEEIQVLLLDFGMPPRLLTITGDFRRYYETSAEAYTDKDESSPNHLKVRCPQYGFGGERELTSYYNMGRYLDYAIDIRRGDYMGVSHFGESAETRNGFIDNNAGIELADEYLRDGDYSASRANLLTIGYVKHGLQIHMHNASNAFVIYGKSIGFADRHQQTTADPEELEQLLGRLANEDPRDVVRELFGNMAVMAVQNEDITAQLETIEALFARNKGLLAEARRENWHLKSELDKAKLGKTASSESDWFKSIFEGSMRGEGSLTDACKLLGLDPVILSHDSQLVANLASMARRAWSKTLHPDLQTDDARKDAETKLKAVNDAADILETRFRK